METKTCLTGAEIQAKLLAAGVQPTMQRIAIARHVLCEADHATAEQIIRWAGKNLEKISQATVYNTLNILVEAGLLRTFKFPHSEKVIYDCSTHDHYHFLDEATGSLYDIDKNDVSVEVKGLGKFQVSSVDLMFKGQFKNEDT
ncbi:MAG: transcriptional repressor [Proteobacteria bacterium]|nr:MAG: transcriptional repressor [Pseudomonadota bacterium]